MSYLPNAFLIGAQKAGTTTLASMLAQHRDVCVCQPKEPGFLRRDIARSAAEARYRAVFTEPGRRYRLDASTVYSQVGTYPGVAARIRSICPEARILYLVRHPLERIESAWVQMRSERSTSCDPDFNRAVLDDTRLIDATLYATQLREYAQHFPAEQILVLFFDDLRLDLDSVWARSLAHLDLPAWPYRREAVADNRSAGKTQEPEWLQRLRTSAGPLVRSIHRLGPLRKVLARARDRMARPLNRPIWSRAALDHVRKRLDPELDELWAAHGAGRPRWVLDRG